MGNIKKQDMGYRIGVQADRTTVAAALLDFAPPADGVALAPGMQMVDLDTDHALAGEMYSDLAARNQDEQQVRTYLYPTTMGTFLSAVFDRDTNGDLYFQTIERWWRSVLGGTEDKGERFYGAIFNKISLNLGRTNRNDAIEADFGVFINAKDRIQNAESAPSLDFCKCFPFGTAGVLMDFVRDAAADSYGADDLQVRSVQISFNNDVSLDGIQDDLRAGKEHLHRTWLVQAAGNPSADITVVTRITEDELLRLDQFNVVPKGKLRVALVHPKGTTTTTTSTITAGTTGAQVLLTAVTTGILVGDVVVITHPTTGFVLARVSAISAGVSITVNGTTASDPRVTLNGSIGGPLTIRNMAAGLVFDRMDYNGRGPTRRDGSFQTIELRYKAKLLAGSTSIVEKFGYDHLNSRIS